MDRWIWILWAVLSVCWVAFAGYLCVNLWPHLSLDLSHTDPATLAVYDRAVATHIVLYSALAAALPIGALGLWWFIARR